MGTLIGHVAPGVGFLVIGLWHLFNNIKLHALYPADSYTSSPWFRAPSIKYLELYLIIAGSTLSIAMELFIGPDRHQPFDPDGTIPSNHLHNFEHSSISMSLIIYAVFAILFDRIRLKTATHDGLAYMLAAFAFSQQFLLFHLHSADHMGVEGQYHLLLQLVILVSLITTLMGIGFPKSFLVSFVRSLSILFQGVWFIVMGFMLWIPEFIPKGCFMNFEESHFVVRCHGDHALHRAKSLVNLQFNWLLSMIVVFSMSMYIILNKIYGGKVEYLSINKTDEEQEKEEIQDVELQKVFDESRSFIHIGKAMPPIDMER
ncbi:Protein of unknown function DUF716 [Macleaya cordata]|uniref:Transmembrane protein 45B n=1 Tax=Macleaya cordata TaxID=56857 RepID=A0A200R0J3_MACCD|nr:Protein of unknown function DUF716 [Macleaya cordata]